MPSSFNSFLNTLIVYILVIFNHLTLGHDSLVKSQENLTVNDRSDLEALLQAGCRELNKDINTTAMEPSKEHKSLIFAVIYSGQVCHGRGALVLYDEEQMRIYWKNKRKYLHQPLQTWGHVDIFGLFEEMTAGSIAIGGSSAGTQERADGCNDFISHVNWTRIEFMPSEAHLKKGKVIAHGEERRIEALNRFIGSSNWRKYDLVLQFRPDVMLRKPITEWGISFTKINYAHFEGGPRVCDPDRLLKNLDISKASGVPLMGDPFIIYPKKWVPIFMYYGANVQGRSSLSMLRQQCRCCHIQASSDVHVLDMNACHNTRSCLYHPYYYLFGERSCGEKDRPGESLNEFCNPGSMHEVNGLYQCGAAGMKTLRGMSRDELGAFIAFNAKYYSPYNGPIELDSCMENSTLGVGCV